MINSDIDNAFKPSEKKEKSFFLIFTQIVPLILILFAIVYTFITKPISDFLKYGLYIDAAIICLFAIFFLVAAIKFGYKNKPVEGFIPAIIIILVGLPFLAICYYSIAVSFIALYHWLSSPSISRGFLIFAISLSTLYIAGFLFYFRYKARAIYGFSEVVIGLLVAINRVYNINEPLSSTSFLLPILTASVYLIVRGFDNIHQGLTKDPLDKFALKHLKILLDVLLKNE